MRNIPINNLKQLGLWGRFSPTPLGSERVNHRLPTVWPTTKERTKINFIISYKQNYKVGLAEKKEKSCLHK